jgi:hypothetical protein
MQIPDTASLRSLGLVAIVAAAFSTSGCELAAMGLLMPGVMPGVGFPIEGEVRDGRTYLPVGGATVHSGLGTTLTDAKGRFSLYGSLSSREISVSRASYTSKTIGGQKLVPGKQVTVTIDPIGEPNGRLPTGILDLRGSVMMPGGQTATPDGLVMLAGARPTAVSNGRFQITYDGQEPGRLVSRMLAGGRIDSPYDEKATVFQPFQFLSFGYQLQHLVLGEIYPQALREGNLVIDPNTKFRDVRVTYTNLGRLTNVQTTILLDFGVAGAVTVAQKTGSNQLVSVPHIEGVKYVISGEALNEGKTQYSSVIITTANPSQAPFQLLTPPQVLAPLSGAKRVGARPTFRWSALSQPGMVYEISLFEGDEITAKWVATTPEAEITYPGFSLSDVNGGALRPDKKYRWSVRAIDMLAPTENATNQRNLMAVEPLRSRKREASNTENDFTI